VTARRRRFANLAQFGQDHTVRCGIKCRAKAFDRSPFWFTLWDVTTEIVKIAFWLGFWSIIAQCTCSGCIWGKP
jgi:hypothetical protein